MPVDVSCQLGLYMFVERRACGCRADAEPVFELLLPGVDIDDAAGGLPRGGHPRLQLLERVRHDYDEVLSGRGGLTIGSRLPSGEMSSWRPMPVISYGVTSSTSSGGP